MGWSFLGTELREVSLLTFFMHQRLQSPHHHFTGGETEAQRG